MKTYSRLWENKQMRLNITLLITIIMDKNLSQQFTLNVDNL